jgi:hypothetical protein
MGSNDKGASIGVGIALSAFAIFIGGTWYWLFFGGGSKPDGNSERNNTGRPVFTGSDDLTEGGATKRRKSIRKRKTKNKNSKK